MDIPYPPRLSLARLPTPLEPLDRLSESLNGPRIWVKRDDLTGSHLSGNKIRKLEFVIARAKQEGCDTLITCGGLQSNHCRATALLGAQLGLKVHLLLRGETSDVPDGNLLLDYLAGAEVTCYPARGYSARLPALAQHWQAHYREAGRKAFFIPIGASDATGTWGYLACCEELQHDFQVHNINPAYIICASGSGGTQAGLTLGCALYGLHSQVLGFAVCDDEAYFQAKVREDLQAWKRRYAPEQLLPLESIAVNDHYIGPGYAKATPEVFNTIKWVASTEGLVLDPVYSGKAFHGMIEEIRQGRFDGVEDIVFVHTGGIYGLFPQREEIFRSL